MSAASVAVVVTTGERHEGKAGMVFAGTVNCDPCLSALYVSWCEKALYKYSSFPFVLTALGVLRMLPVLQRLGDAYSF